MTIAPRLAAERLLPPKPQVNLTRNTGGRMWLVSLCGGLAVIQSSLTDRGASLLVALLAVGAAVLAEFFILHSTRKAAYLLKDGSAVASALTLTLLLPNTISPLSAAAGAFFAIAVVKHSFGGLGANWLNPAAGGWLFVRLSWPDAWTRALTGSLPARLAEGVSQGFSGPGRSPLEIIQLADSAGVTARPSAVDSFLRTLLNERVLSRAGAELPGGYLGLFASIDPGIIADRGVLGLLLGTAALVAFQAGRAWVPLVWLGVYLTLARLAGALFTGGLWGQGDMLFALCSGGALAAAFILAADPATSAKSLRGVLAATAASGALAWTFRYAGAEPYGAVYAVMFVNALLPSIRALETRLYAAAGRTL